MEMQGNDGENQSGDAGNPCGNLAKNGEKISMDMINSKSGEKSK